MAAFCAHSASSYLESAFSDAAHVPWPSRVCRAPRIRAASNRAAGVKTLLVFARLSALQALKPPRLEISSSSSVNVHTTGSALRQPPPENDACKFPRPRLQLRSTTSRSSLLKGRGCLSSRFTLAMARSTVSDLDFEHGDRAPLSCASLRASVSDPLLDHPLFKPSSFKDKVSKLMARDLEITSSLSLRAFKPSHSTSPRTPDSILQ
ncbi:hypothetical protein C8R45DRAFT_1005740 [Mycena sanguinolenta]|nr:hypothetical protein C8R45DRAFT_1005740 [Mycena sanguinolenta]